MHAERRVFREIAKRRPDWVSASECILCNATACFVCHRTVGVLSLNYLQVARAAQFCSAYFTSLLYVDLWAHEQVKEIRNRGNQSTLSQGPSTLDLVIQCESPDIQEELQLILREVSLCQHKLMCSNIVTSNVSVYYVDGKSKTVKYDGR